MNLDEVRNNVESIGWHMVVIPEEVDKPAVAYTIGLYESFGHPELAMLGMPYPPMLLVLGEISNGIRNENKHWNHGDESKEFLQNEVPIFFASITEEENMVQFMTAIQYYKKYGKEKRENSPLFPILQVIWPDENGKFPHEESCRYTVKYQQPVLSTTIEIKNPWLFKEAPFTRCIISESIIREQKPILFVGRALNGVWQFLAEKPIQTPKTFSVFLEEVCNYDKTIGAVSSLPSGNQIFRETEDSDWVHLTQ